MPGFAAYGRATEKVFFPPDDRRPPAIAINNGVDCVPMRPREAFPVQLLSIAGAGPVFGALMGACFGPVVFLWIVVGSVLGGAVHDYMSGMISCRHGGDPAAELFGIYPGNAAKWIMRVFPVALPKAASSLSMETSICRKIAIPGIICLESLILRP